jgi:hypothetical protein
MQTETKPWHSVSVDEAAAELSVVPAQGLDNGEAQRRLARWG